MKILEVSYIYDVEQSLIYEIRSKYTMVHWCLLIVEIVENIFKFLESLPHDLLFEQDICYTNPKPKTLVKISNLECPSLIPGS